MDNKLIEQLSAQIHHDAHHAAEEAVRSPAAVNRNVGESMRHIGQLLFGHSTPYLPVRPEEVLIPPQPLDQTSLDAIVLVKRQIRSENAFMVMITSKGEDNLRNIDLVGFKDDPFDLTNTRFMKLTPQIGNELVRQANLLIKGEGVTLLQAVIVQNFFGTEAPRTEPSDDGLFSSDLSPEPPVPTEAPAPAPAYDGKGLPPVDSELL